MLPSACARWFPFSLSGCVMNVELHIARHRPALARVGSLKSVPADDIYSIIQYMAKECKEL